MSEQTYKITLKVSGADITLELPDFEGLRDALQFAITTLKHRGITVPFVAPAGNEGNPYTATQPYTPQPGANTRTAAVSCTGEKETVRDARRRAAFQAVAKSPDGIWAKHLAREIGLRGKRYWQGLGPVLKGIERRLEGLCNIRDVFHYGVRTKNGSLVTKGPHFDTAYSLLFPDTK